MLNKKQIQQLISEQNLITGYINIEKQLTPNGFDLTVGKIFEFDAGGALDFSNNERVLPQGKEIIPQKRNPEDTYGWWKLARGAYKVMTNETVAVPNNMLALGLSRTSLLRMGAFTQNGVWDAGFKGRSEFILVVENPFGITIKENARIVQLVLFAVEKTESYKGIYQGK